MPRIGEQGDVLRALGRFLDEQGAAEIDIKLQGQSFAVTYKVAAERGGQVYYNDQDLDALRAKAQFLRSGNPGVAGDGSLAELLRTLGQELDDAGVELTSLGQDADAFRVSGLKDGLYHTQPYYFYQLREASAERRAARGKGGGRTPEEIDPILGVTVGAPVFTWDNQRLGKVGEVRGRAFKVEPNFLQRDYWLPASCIAAASKGQPVLLAIRKVEVASKKRSAPAKFPEERNLPPRPTPDAWY
ncbi:MAG TPA: hypothetical protein VFC51_02650 [Chloroflexota bacterium]|nr:hypothetical protein [Chloroflexota bacterium]